MKMRVGWMRFILTSKIYIIEILDFTYTLINYKELLNDQIYKRIPFL